MYRPKEWEESIEDFMRTSPELEMSGLSQRDKILYEAGADAMLEALKKTAITSFIDMAHKTTGVDGHMVFIPWD